MTDGVHQVRLAKSNAAVEEERVVGLRRHADLEGILFTADERRILQPGLVARLTELETKLFLRRLPDLLWVHTLLHSYTHDRLVGEQSRTARRTRGRKQGPWTALAGTQLIHKLPTMVEKSIEVSPASCA